MLHYKRNEYANFTKFVVFFNFKLKIYKKQLK